MGIVYVVQKQMTRDGGGNWVPKFDVSPAARFGELKVVFAPQIRPAGQDFSKQIAHARTRMHDARPGDCLVLTGSPPLLGICTLVMSELTGGNFTLLFWDKREQLYIPLPVVMK